MANNSEFGNPGELDSVLRVREIDHRRFSKILPLVARAMALDKHLLICHLAYVKTRVFEAPAALLAMLVQQCVNIHNSRLSKEEAYRCVPDMTVLNHCFTMNDYVKFCVNGHILDGNGHKGISHGESVSLYHSMNRQMKERMEARLEKIKKVHPHTMKTVPTLKPLGKAEAEGFTGAEELQVLVEELFKLCPRGKFVSPMAMVVHMIRQGTESPLVNQETIAAGAAMAVVAMKRDSVRHASRRGSVEPDNLSRTSIERKSHQLPSGGLGELRAQRSPERTDAAMVMVHMPTV